MDDHRKCEERIAAIRNMLRTSLLGDHVQAKAMLERGHSLLEMAGLTERTLKRSDLSADARAAVEALLGTVVAQ